MSLSLLVGLPQTLHLPKLNLGRSSKKGLILLSKFSTNLNINPGISSSVNSTILLNLSEVGPPTSDYWGTNPIGRGFC